MKIKDHKYFTDIKLEAMSEAYNTPTDGMKKAYQPLDLSLRCNSVDTFNTLSPYSTGSGSPPMETSPDKINHDRSAAYSDRSPHQSPYPPFLKDFTAAYPCQKRETPSPDHSYYPTQHNQQACNIAPYMIQAAALQQRLSQQTPPAEDESTEMGSLNRQMINSYPFQLSVGRDGKLSRPFKAYARDPFNVASFSLVNNQSAEKFEMFRMKMLKHIHAANGGQPTVSNPKMRRTSSRTESNADSETVTNNNNSDSSNGGVKDSAYFERRKKNNAAAKKSRDRRRIKEDEIAIRATFLESENREINAENLSLKTLNTELKMEVAALQKALALARCGKIVE